MQFPLLVSDQTRVEEEAEDNTVILHAPAGGTVPIDRSGQGFQLTRARRSNR